MAKQRTVDAYIQPAGIESAEDDILVNVTLHRVPGDLVREFARKIVVNYPGGISEAIQSLMRQALEK